MIKEFFDFLKQHNIVGLAIAVIIAGKLNELVSSLINDLVVPVILQPALRAASVDDIRKLSFNGILYGKVLGTSIDFTIVAFVIFVIVKYLLKEEKLIKKA